MANLPTLNDDTLDSTLQASDQPVLVDFSAAWCQPCKALARKIEKVADEFEGQLKVFSVDIEDAQAAVHQLNIEGVPTCVFFKNGREVDRFLGDPDINSLRERVNKVL